MRISGCRAPGRARRRSCCASDFVRGRGLASCRHARRSDGRSRGRHSCSAVGHVVRRARGRAYRGLRGRGRRQLGRCDQGLRQPEQQEGPFPSACTATWSGYGLTIGFYNLGGADPCAPSGGRFSRAVMHGKRWRTSKGLRVGMVTSRVRRYYPRATWHRGLRSYWPTGWWLVTRPSRIGLGDSKYPGLLAETRNGRVVSLQVRYPAGGD